MDVTALEKKVSEKKVAIITGSTKGIGRAIAECLAASGFQVVITSRTLAQAQDVASAMQQQGLHAVGVAFNIESQTSGVRLIEQTMDQFGRLDVLVNNALSTSALVPLDSAKAEAIEKGVTSNLTHTLLLTRLAYPHLKLTRGHVINIASAVVNRHVLGIPLYTILKGALNQMTTVLASEWAQDQIRVNGINPGFIRTEAFFEMGMSRDQVDKSYDHYQAYHPMGSVGKPLDIGHLVAFLCSDGAGFISGVNIGADAAFSVQGVPMFIPEAS